MTRFEGKTVLVTGGTSGIGLAGAEQLRKEGARVIVTGRSPEHIAQARERLGPDTQVIDDDAADPDSPDRLLAIAQQAGGLDALWLNAAYASAADIASLDRAELERMFAVNVFAPMLQIGRLAPLLRDGGAVLATSSTSAHEGQATLAAYAASKGAVLSAARCWAAELAPRGIRVNTLVPRSDHQQASRTQRTAGHRPRAVRGVAGRRRAAGTGRRSTRGSIRRQLPAVPRCQLHHRKQSARRWRAAPALSRRDRPGRWARLAATFLRRSRRGALPTRRAARNHDPACRRRARSPRRSPRSRDRSR